MPARNFYYCQSFIIFLLGLVFQACNNNKLVPDKSAPEASAAKVQQLVTRGKTLQNTYTDSLVPIYTELRSLNDKTALTYGDFFEGVFYWHEGNHQRAMELAVKALAEAEKWDIRNSLTDIYLLIGNLDKEKRNYDMAFKNADLALQIAQQNKDTAGIISSLGNKAMFTRGYFITINKPKADHQSLQMQLQGLKMAQTNPKYEQISIKFYTNIAQSYKDSNNLTKTLLYANKGVELAKKYGQKRSLTYAYCWIGEALYHHGDHAGGLDYLNKALRETREIREPFREMEIYGTLYSCNLSTGDYKQALLFANKKTALHDSLRVSDNLKQLSELQLKYEGAKKDQQIKFLAREGDVKSRQLLWILFSSILFCVLFVLLFVMYFTIRRQHRQITEKNMVLNDVLRKIAFVQSHEMRRPLASILGLINVIRAENYHVEKDCWDNLEKSSRELDERIRSIITQTQVDGDGA